MPDDIAVDCDSGKKKNILGVSTDFMKDVGKGLAWILTATVAIIVFYFVSERDQEQRVSDNKAKAEASKAKAQKVEERLSDHIKHSIKAFDRSTQTFNKLDDTMRKQHMIISKTREMLSGMNATQEGLKKDNGRLAKAIEELAREVRNSNGHTP